jgi:hypothetical protein
MIRILLPGGQDKKEGRLGLSLAGLSQSVKRGETLAKDKGYKLINP